MTGLEPPSQRSGWYAVRCVFESKWPPPQPGDPNLYEERVTIWQAASVDDAIALAEAEAEEYAESIAEAPSPHRGLAQAYILSDTPQHGAEVFSLIRSSQLDATTTLTPSSIQVQSVMARSSRAA